MNDIIHYKTFNIPKEMAKDYNKDYARITMLNTAKTLFTRIPCKNISMRVLQNNV